jgi:hypothetical protein
VVNVSARGRVIPGGTVSAGFTIGGAAARRVLIRAIGPSLRLFGHPDPLENPILEIFAGGAVRATNSGEWSEDPEVPAIAAVVGAFALPAGSRDAVLITTLPPGSYTAVVRGAAPADEGEVVAEVYLVD